MKITKLSETEELVEVHGHQFTRLTDGIITKCHINGCCQPIHLGQKVYSNGRFGPPDGTMGLVIEIHLPGEGYTTNLFQVWFEGELSPCEMKPKDLQTERLAETSQIFDR